MHIFINAILTYTLDEIPLYCTIESIEILGYAVHSLYPTREANDTINEVSHYNYVSI